MLELYSHLNQLEPKGFKQNKIVQDAKKMTQEKNQENNTALEDLAYSLRIRAEARIHEEANADQPLIPVSSQRAAFTLRLDQNLMAVIDQICAETASDRTTLVTDLISASIIPVVGDLCTLWNMTPAEYVSHAIQRQTQGAE